MRRSGGLMGARAGMSLGGGTPRARLRGGVARVRTGAPLGRGTTRSRARAKLRGVVARLRGGMPLPTRRCVAACRGCDRCEPRERADRAQGDGHGVAQGEASGTTRRQPHAAGDLRRAFGPKRHKVVESFANLAISDEMLARLRA